MRNFLLIFVLVFMFQSCYKEELLYSNLVNDKSSMQFFMTDSQFVNVIDARMKQWALSPTPSLVFDNKEYTLDRFALRGESTLNFQRKSFSVNMDDHFSIIDRNNRQIEIDKFKLISMVYDLTYIENFIGTELMRMVDVWPLTTFFTEISLNNKTQGLYFFIEDPNFHYIDQKKNSCIIRRGYGNTISEIECSDSTLVNDYTNRFRSIYDIIVNFSGLELYNELSKVLDLEEYFKFMAINYLLHNGDYTDEVYFYSSITNDGFTPFKINAWDLDDLFVSNPHEVSRTWSVGSKFGKRFYANRNAVLEVINDRVVFSIEDDLDYRIATDDFLYGEYLKVFQDILATITEDKIVSSFIQLNDELLPFYSNDSIVYQSRFDFSKTDLERYQKNIIRKQDVLLDIVEATHIAVDNQLNQFN